MKKSLTKKEKLKILIILLWCFTFLFLALFLISLPHFYSVFSLLIAVLLPPVVNWQRQIKKIFIKKWIKPVTLIVLLSLLITTAKISETSNGFSNSETKSSIQERIDNKQDYIDTTETANFDINQVSEDIIKNEKFEIHFLDVGEADATLVICGDHYMLIDGGNAADSQFIYAYLKNRNINHLDYIFCTHPHEDHVGGLAGALNYAKVERAFCSEAYYDSEAFNSFLKYLNKQEVDLEVISAGEEFSFGDATVNIVGPLFKNANLNNESLVVRIEYGATSFLIMGDAEMPEEYDILDSCVDIKSTLLRVGHHGSDSSSCNDFLNSVNPQYVIISVGNNGYEHPSTEIINLLKKMNIDIYRTDINGTIICKSDGRNINIVVEKRN